MKIKSNRINLLNSSRVFVLFTLLLLSTSCASVGHMVGGSIQTFSGKYTIELSSSRSDILDVIGSVGKSMSFDISSMDASRGSIGLSSGSSTASAFVGKASRQMISVTSADEGKRLNISVMVSGNFDAGKKEAADKLFSDFKNRLLEKVK